MVLPVHRVEDMSVAPYSKGVDVVLAAGCTMAVDVLDSSYVSKGENVWSYTNHWMSSMLKVEVSRPEIVPVLPDIGEASYAG
jgi:hypothetical protein